MNVIIYARCDYRKKNEPSIELQLQTCYNYAKEKGYEVVGEYIDTTYLCTYKNEFNYTSQREKIIRDSENKKFQAVIVYQQDRFALNRYDSAYAKYRLKQNNVNLLSAMENDIGILSNDTLNQITESVIEGLIEYFGNNSVCDCEDYVYEYCSKDVMIDNVVEGINKYYNLKINEG